MRYLMSLWFAITNRRSRWWKEKRRNVWLRRVVRRGVAIGTLQEGRVPLFNPLRMLASITLLKMINAWEARYPTLKSLIIRAMKLTIGVPRIVTWACLVTRYRRSRICATLTLAFLERKGLLTVIRKTCSPMKAR